jgi:hypothetical protein
MCIIASADGSVVVYPNSVRAGGNQHSDHEGMPPLVEIHSAQSKSFYDPRELLVAQRADPALFE